MSANTYLGGVASYGKKTAATATAVVQTVDPLGGYRLAVVAFGVTAGGGPAGQAFYFERVLGRTTIVSAVASGATTVTFAGDPGPVGNLLATADNVCLSLGDGTYQYTTVLLWDVAGKSCTIASALVASVVAGAQVWDFGVYTDSGHMAFALTAGVQTTKDTSGPGILFAAARGDPMRVSSPNTGSQVVSLDYLSIAGINS